MANSQQLTVALRTLIIHILIFLSLPLLFGQRSSTEKAIIKLFDNQANSLHWMRHYKGRIDDLNDIAVSLAFDGKACKGFLVYLRSRERFLLEGTFKNNQIQLKEIDKQGAVSGFINAKLLGVYINGDWNNFDKSIGGEITLQQVQYEARLPSYCGDDKWIRQYKGMIDGRAYTMILQKQSNESITGTAYSQNETYTIKGEINEYLQVDLKFKDAFNNTIGTLKGNHANEFDLRTNFFNKKGDNKKAPFQMVERFQMGCIEYADYISSYDITYPKTRYASFNQWIDQQAMSWVVNCKNQVQKIRVSYPVKKPKLRATQRAYAWTELVYLSEELISGYITFSDTWTNDYQTKMFNFNLLTGKRLSVKDIFKGRYKKAIRKYIKKEYKKNPNLDFSEFRKWIIKDGFSLFTVREEGISFSTKFNPIFGQQHVLVPYDKLKPYLKKNTAVWNLYKK